MTSKKMDPQSEIQGKISTRMDRAKENANQLSQAVSAGSKAYVDGLFAFGRAFGDYRREILSDANKHLRATVGAKSLREVAELQAAWAQQRIETSTAHTKEIADLARIKAKAVVTPFSDVLGGQKTA